MHGRSRRARVRSSGPRGPADVLGSEHPGIALQRRAGNRAARRLLQRHAAPSLQRAVWRYDGEQWTAGPREGQPEGLPEGAYQAGDRFDDVAGEVYSGRNADVRGEPNRFVGYQAASEEERAVLTEALAIGKMKVARALRAVIDAEQTLRSENRIEASLANVMENAFNMPADLPRHERLRITEIFRAGLERLAGGLDGQGLKLIAASRMLKYGVTESADGCAGWVPRGITELGGQDKPAESFDDLKEGSGDIHLHKGFLGRPEAVADTIVHEASHKFLGTWDYSYSEGGLSSDMEAKVADAQEADDQLGRADAKAAIKDQSRRRVHSRLLATLVRKGIDDVLPVQDRGRPLPPTATPAQQAARMAYDTVRPWSNQSVEPPTMERIRELAASLATMNRLPSKLKSAAAAYVEDPDAFLAEHGNAMNIKDPTVVFALPTGYLLKNADSWQELATLVGA